MISEDFKDLLPKEAASEPDLRPHYLWVYDPQAHKVHIAEEKGAHPAHFPTHGTMVTHVTHPDRLDGYAWAIGGGWRITDNHNHKIEDPYILKQILSALRQEQPPAPLPHVLPHGDPAKHLRHPEQSSDHPLS